MVSVEPGDEALQRELAARDLMRCTRSVVLVKNTRYPFSTRARPMADARWLLPAPGGPKTRQLAPWSSHASPAASALTWAFEIIGTALKSKLARLLPGISLGFPEMAFDAPSVALGELVLDEGREEARGGPALGVGPLGEALPEPVDGRQAQLGEHQGELDGVDPCWGRPRCCPGCRSCRASRPEQGAVAGKERPGDMYAGHAPPIRREARLERVGIGETARLQRRVDGGGELGLAVRLMGERQEGDREPAGLAVAHPLQGPLEAAPVGLAREQRVAVD